MSPSQSLPSSGGLALQPSALAASGATSLLAADEPAAVSVLLPDGSSDVVLACDHASNLLPRALGTLGLKDSELDGHMAWDIGAAGVARLLSERIDATLVLQNYSRLAIDCNRPLTSPESICVRSEWGDIAGNRDLDAAHVAERTAVIFDPYHAALAAVLDRRQRAQKPTLLLSIHSFTPTYRGVDRPWQIGLMFHRDERLANVLLTLLRRDERLLVGVNEPYAMDDEHDYTLPLHGEGRGIAHVGIEIRQDLIVDLGGQKNWAGRLASLLRQASVALSGT